jgi:hypothetical protein
MKIGLDGVAYISADLHQDGTPTYLEADLVEEISQEFSKANATLMNRRSRFSKHSGGTITFSYTLTVTYEDGDAVYDMLYAALISGEPIGLAVMDRSMTDLLGSRGWILDVEVFDGPKNESRDEFDKVAFMLRPSAKSTFEPTELVVPAD